MIRLQLLLEAIARDDPAPPSQDAGVVDEGVQRQILGLKIGAELTDGGKAAQIEADDENEVSGLTPTTKKTWSRRMQTSLLRLDPRHR